MLRKREAPLFATKFAVPTNRVIDFKLIFGAAIFGLGWGLGGLCPGPGFIDAFTLTHAIFWVLAFALGQLIFWRPDVPLPINASVSPLPQTAEKTKEIGMSVDPLMGPTMDIENKEKGQGI